MNSRIIHIAERILIAALLFVSFALAVNAQPTGADSPQSGHETSGRADQNNKSISRVNPNTLAMELELPILSYPGRAGNGSSISYSYSSKVWRMSPGEPWWRWVNSHKVYITDLSPIFGENTAGGWTTSLAPPRIEYKYEIYDQDGSSYTSPIDGLYRDQQWNNFIESLTTITPNFAQLLCTAGGFCCTLYICHAPDANHQINCNCYNWIPNPGVFPFPENPPPPEPPGPPPPGGGSPTPALYYVRRYTAYLPDGSQHEFRSTTGPTQCGSQNGCPETGDGYGTYLSVDDSGTRLERDAGGSTIYMPDGGKYVFPATPTNNLAGNLPSKYVDADGNVTTYSTTNDTVSSVTTATVTDTFGRQVHDVMPLNTSMQRHSAGTEIMDLDGIGSAKQHYEVTWKNLKPFDCETDTTGTCGGGDGALEDQTQKLFYPGRYKRVNGSTYVDLLTNPGNINDPANEVLFPNNGLFGLASVTGHAGVYDADGNIMLDGDGRALVAPSRFNPVVLSKVTLPNGKSYEFKYNRYGEITKILYPTGKVEEFDYGYIAPIDGADEMAYAQTNRGVIERRVYASEGSTPEQVWRYSAGIDPVSNAYTVTTIAPTGSEADGHGIKTERRLISAWINDNFGYHDPLQGKAYDERVFSEGANGTLRSRTLTDWFAKEVDGRKSDARVKRTITISIENGQALATMKENEYAVPGQAGAPSGADYFAQLNVKSVKTHHFRTIPVSLAETGTIDQIAAYFSSATVATKEETDYLYDDDYHARGINALPLETRSIDPATGNVLAKVQTVYDNEPHHASYPFTYLSQKYDLATSYNCNPTTPCWEDPDTKYRGHPTTTRVWDSDNSTWIETHTNYDIFGNAVKVRNAVGNEVTTEFAATYNYAYPTKVTTSAPDPTNTTGTDQTSSVETTYDPNTGLPVTVKDDFGQITATEYNDPLLRPTRVYGQNFTAPESQTIYDDNARTVKVRKQLDANNWDEATTFFDVFGRPIKTQAKDSQGDVFVETHYDHLGRADRVTSPYRSTDTPLWSKTRFDDLGRAVETFAPTELSGLANAQSLGVTSYDISSAPGYFGVAVKTTDASGRESLSVTNALGQLIVVEEPDSDGHAVPLPTSTPQPQPSPGGGGGTGQCVIPENCQGSFAGGSFPSYATYYKYDVKGHMVEAIQGDQHRYFKYDSLGRMIRVRQPEQEVNASLNMTDAYNTSGQWTAGFTYDVMGNVLTATDAKNVTITNTYDKANRVTSRTYSNEPQGVTTPPVHFYYDGKGLAQPQSPNFAKGKLTRVENGISATEYMTFDNFGRLTRSRQITDGVVYGDDAHPITYTYNLSGALVQETYPSGRVVKNDFESDGDLARIYGNAAVAAPERTYANSFSYTTDGRIESLRLGNGLWEKAVFNSRRQVTELNLGHGLDGDLWKLGYEYGELRTDGTVDTVKNTGNIARQAVSFNGLPQPFVQSYRYDSLFRLTEATETQNGTQTWTQQFGYDRYGNRVSTAQNISGIANNTTPAVDPLTNRFVTAGTTFQYDLNGNLVQDQEGRQFTFNGDNKQSVVKDANGNKIGEYFYDGEGRRVKKLVYDPNGVLQETTIFVYSSGKLIAEYSTAAPSANPTTNYTATDMLGSPRVLTDSLGNVVSRRDFLPFGEEISPDGSHRTSSLNYDFVDGIRQKFTGYQRDEETNLDFAEARYYSNQHARFTAVDPLLASGKSANPQTFNRYVYTMNRPLVLTDAKGLQAGCPPGVPGTGCAEEVVAVIVIWVRTINNYLNYKDGAFELDQLPEGTRYRERFTSHGPIGEFIQPGQPVGDAIKAGNKAMDDLNTHVIQKIPLMNNLVNAQMNGVKGDNAGVVKEMGLFGFDLGTTLFTGGTGKAVTKAGTTVLGKFPKYLEVASELGANRFNIPGKIWKGMSAVEQWAANRKFLDRAIARGDQILLSDPISDLSKVTGSLRKEIDYLISKGYKLSEDGKELIK